MNIDGTFARKAKLELVEQLLADKIVSVDRDNYGRIRRAHFLYIEHEELNDKPLGSIWSRTALGAACDVSRYAAERIRRVSEAPGAHSKQEWQAIVEFYDSKCLCCGVPASETAFGRLTKDHVVPLSQGGSDFASNLQPLCKSCNSRKGTREIDYRKKLMGDMWAPKVDTAQ